MSKPIPIENRFWQKALIGDDCWEWAASVGTHGYGQISVDRKPQPAHIVAYRLTHGVIPAGLYVLHRCDNRKCVRPAHLFLGTHADNMADMKAKGRGGSWPRPGESNPAARLTNEQARAIRALCSTGTSQRAAGRLFGVSQKVVWGVVSGGTYSC